MPRLCSAALVLAVVASIPALAAAQEVRIAAASDLQAALPELVTRFERQRGYRVAVTYGSSGNFFAQIQNGAPFDVYLSADIDYPRRLERDGLTEPGTLLRYATGRLVVWTRTDSGIDLRSGLASLANPAVRRIAIANPDHAPYGRAAVAALRAAGVYDRVRARFLLGENISQTAQFAQSGNADVAILALSLARGTALRTVGTFVEVPASLHPPIDQGAVALRSSRNKIAARRFLEFLATAEAIAHLNASGFEVPPQEPRGR